MFNKNNIIWALKWKENVWHCCLMVGNKSGLEACEFAIIVILLLGCSNDLKYFNLYKFKCR